MFQDVSAQSDDFGVVAVAGVGERDGEVGLDAGGAVADDEDAVGHQQGFFHVVGHEQGGEAAVLPDADQFALHLQPGQAVELAEWLVQDEQAGVVDQGPGQGGPLRHAAGDLVRVGGVEAFESHQVQRLVHAVAEPFQLAPGFEPERDVGADGAPGIERRVLEHEHAGRVGAGDWRGVGQDVPLAGQFQARHQSQQGGLAAARGAEDGHELAGGQRQADPVQHRQGLAVQREGVADVHDVERQRSGWGAVRGAGQGAGPRLHHGAHHRTSPFCQDSERSRTWNSSVISAVHINAITPSATYMLA